MTGTIKKLCADRGYGFITTGENKSDIFFHAQGLVNKALFCQLEVGQKVTYEPVMHELGPRAVQVAVVGAVPPGVPSVPLAAITPESPPS